MGLQHIWLHSQWSQRLPTRLIQAPLSRHQMFEIHGGTLMQSWLGVNAFLNIISAAPSHLSHLPSIKRPPSRGLPAVKSRGRVGGVSSLGRCDGIDRVCFARQKPSRLLALLRLLPLILLVLTLLVGREQIVR